MIIFSFGFHHYECLNPKSKESSANSQKSGVWVLNYAIANNAD